MRLSISALGALFLLGGAQAASAHPPVPLLLLQSDDTDAPPAFDSGEFDAAYDNYSADNELQRERPVLDLDLPDDPPDYKPRRRWSFPDWLTGLGSGLGQLLQIVFWAAIVIGTLAILYFLFTQLRNTNFKRNKKKSDKKDIESDHFADVRPDEQTARTLLEEADVLAREGKYAEAVHLLLFRSINDIQERLEGGVSKSLTSREIGSLEAIPDNAKSALSPIIHIVEGSYFGDADVTEADWTTARKAYETFAFGEGWT